MKFKRSFTDAVYSFENIIDGYIFSPGDEPEDRIEALEELFKRLVHALDLTEEQQKALVHPEFVPDA